MTTTETDAKSEQPEDQPADQVPEEVASGGPPVEPPALDAESNPRNEALWTRAILPLALPFLAAIATAFWVINLSRAFLAGSKTGAVVVVMVVTLTIMAGAAAMSAASRMRASTRLLVTGGMLVLIMSAGLVSLGPSEEHEVEAAGYVPPKGQPVATLRVEGLASVKFDKDEYTVAPSGVINVEYFGAPGHTLVFDDPKFAGFLLATPKSSEKAELDPGEYTIYCNVAGHRAQGMEAALTVEEAAAPPASAPPAPAP